MATASRPAVAVTGADADPMMPTISSIMMTMPTNSLEAGSSKHIDIGPDGITGPAPQQASVYDIEALGNFVHADLICETAQTVKYACASCPARSNGPCPGRDQCRECDTYTARRLYKEWGCKERKKARLRELTKAGKLIASKQPGRPRGSGRRKDPLAGCAAHSKYRARNNRSVKTHRV